MDPHEKLMHNPLSRQMIELASLTSYPRNSGGHPILHTSPTPFSPPSPSLPVISNITKSSRHVARHPDRVHLGQGDDDVLHEAFHVGRQDADVLASATRKAPAPPRGGRMRAGSIPSLKKQKPCGNNMRNLYMSSKQQFRENYLQGNGLFHVSLHFMAWGGLENTPPLGYYILYI